MTAPSILSASPPRFLSRLRPPGLARLAPLGVCLLAAALFLLPGAHTAEAQTTAKLVSNLGQTSWGDGNITFASTDTSFTTGSNALGYVLRGVKLVAKRATSSPGSYDMTIRQGGRAGTLITTPRSPALSGSFQNALFVGSGSLSPNTTYWVQLFGAKVRVDATQSDNEDSGGAAGWSIGNTGKMAGSESGGASIKMEVLGYARVRPTLANAIPDRAALAGTAFSYAFPASTFAVAASGQTLKYKATKPNNTALPSWLTFTPGTRTFSGTPGPGNVGRLSVKVTALYGVDVKSDTFDIVVKSSNNAPTVANAIPDQDADTGTAFSFAFPANTFADTDSGDTLGYTATKSDGTALPSWLTFTPSTRTFSGTPQTANVGTVSVKVTASDGIASVSDTFDIFVEPTPPCTAKNNPDVQREHFSATSTATTITVTYISQGPTAFRFELCTSGSSTVTSTTLGRNPTHTFTGLTVDTDHWVRIFHGGTSLWQHIRTANAAPTVANAIPDRVAVAGTAFSYAFPADTFADTDSGDTLTYTTTKSDGTALPSWLTFTAGTRTFSGTPQSANIGTLSVKVTASDGTASVSDTFDIVVKASNNAPTVANAIPDQAAEAGTAFSYAFPANTFADADSGDTLGYTATKSDGNALPSWLTFTAGTRTFSGTPQTANVGTLSVKVTASDGTASVSDTFDIVVRTSVPCAASSSPHVRAEHFSLISTATTIAVSYIRQGLSSFRFELCTSGSSTVTETGWTNNVKHTFTGLTVNTDYWVRIKHTTGVAPSVWKHIRTVNVAPTVANAIPDRVAVAGTAFSYAFPADTFADADSGDTLTYTATKSDGTALPSWLTFTAGTRTFSGTPQSANIGTLSVKVTASDGKASVSDTFDIVVKTSNNAPTVANAVPDQAAVAGTAFSYAFPANTFADKDTGDTLVYSATKSDGTALPSWLTFTASTRTFSGTPQTANAGTLPVKVTASDGTASVSDTFDIVVKASNTAPTVANAIPDRKAVAGTAFSYAFPANTFADTDTGDTLTYTPTKFDGSALPVWLTFTPGTRTFSGTPQSANAGTLSVKVTASDGFASVSDTFDIVVKASNTAPTVANAIPDRGAVAGTAFSYAFPANTFADTDTGDTLTYTPTTPDGGALPSWLTFTAGTRTFSGTPQSADAGTLSVKVTASDGFASVSDTFNIVVKASNSAPTVANAIPDQTAAAGTAFSYAFPANTFADADSGDTLTYTATKSDNSALPSWLSFTAGTRAFSGTPAAGDAGTLSVKVTASDGFGGTVSDTFDIVVAASNNAPTVTGVAIWSTPSLDTDDSGTPETYGQTEKIRVQVTFSEAVTVTGTPRLTIKMDPNYGEIRANYESGSGSTVLTFAHTVVDPNRSSVGIAVLENTLALNGGTIRAGTVNAVLGHAGLAHDAGHKVDWRIAGTPQQPPQPPQPRDTTPPRVSAAPTVDGATLTIVFDERLAGGAVPPAAFEVMVGGGDRVTPSAVEGDRVQGPAQGHGARGGDRVTPSAVEVDNRVTPGKVTLTLPAAVAHGETVEVRYTRPAAHDTRLRDVAGNAVADFTRTVTNETPAPPPGSPVADAGADLAVDPGASVTLDGTGSTDPDGEVLTYAWSRVSGAAVTLFATAARTTFRAPERPGALEFQLTVTDPGGLSDSDRVTVTVRDLAPSFGAARVPSLVLVPGEAMAPVVLPEATGGNGALSYALTSDPAGLAGLSVDAATRTLSGTPAAEAAGRYVFTWRADDADDNRADADAAVLTFAVAVIDPRTAQVKRAVRHTLAAVAHQVLTSALGNIGARFAASVPASGLTLAGETVPFEVSGAGAGLAAREQACAPGSAGGHRLGPVGGGAARDGCAPVAERSRTGEVSELLPASAFSLTLGAAEGSGISSPSPLWSVWGRGDLGAFAGRPEAGMRYEGELRTGWLGIDVRVGPWVAGLAVSHGTGETDYRFDGAAGSGDGRLETELTALYPYGRWTLADGLELRGVLGAGRGVARHRLDGGEWETGGLTMGMASAGVRYGLPTLATVDLAVRADASIARMVTEDGPDYVDGLTADSWRARLGLEASRRIALHGDTALTPFVEAAGRQDGGDGLEGTGLEVAGGLRLEAPRLHIEARGRWLAAHSEEGAEERGLSMTARMGPGAHGRGLSLMLSPRWGAGTGGAEALWRDELPTAAGAPPGDAGALDARIGYGVGAASHGLLTPFAEAGLADDDWRLRLGTRFEAEHMNLGVELAGEHREGGAAGPEQMLKLDLKLRH